MNASVFLKGDVIASPIGSRTLLFPSPFSIASFAALARLSIYATARSQVQKLPCSHKNAGALPCEKEMRFEGTVLALSINGNFIPLHESQAVSKDLVRLYIK